MELPVEKIKFKDELYEALLVHWLDYIYELPEEINNVLLLGHNPWLSMLASSFAGSIRELARYELTAFEFESKSGRKNGDMCREIMNVK